MLLRHWRDDTDSLTVRFGDNLTSQRYHALPDSTEVDFYIKSDMIILKALGKGFVMPSSWS